VVAVRLSRTLVDAGADLFDERCHPDGAYAQAVEVALFDLLQHSGEVTALEVAQDRAVFLPAQGAVV
jgi:hypothetical protein